MISVMFCIRRRPELSAEEFHAYWRDAHAARVRPRAGALGIRRYVQHHTVPGGITDGMGRSRGTGAPFDGVAQVYFEDVGSMLAAGRTPEGSAALADLAADEARFIDFAHSSMFLVEEVEVIAP